MGPFSTKEVGRPMDVRRHFLCHWLVILRQTLTELFDALSVLFVLRTFIKYSVAFRNRVETDADVMSGMFVRLVVPDMAVCDDPA